MSLTEVVETEHIESDSSESVEETKMEVYSPKLDKYVPLDLNKPEGEIQKYNVGLAPGTWY